MPYAFQKLSVFSVAMLMITSSTSFAQGPVNTLMRQDQEQKTRLARKQLALPKTAETKAPEKKWKGTMGLVLQGKRYDSAVSQKSTTVFSVSGNLNYVPLSSIRFNFSPRFDYSTGYSVVSEKTDASKSTWSVSNASVDFLPSPYLTAAIGALDQSAPHSEILFDAYAFPAVALTVTTLPENNYVVGAAGESAIVTSTNLSTDKKEYEKTPTFQSANLLFKAQNQTVEGDLKAGVFEFNNLPSSVADSASKLGNSTVATGTLPRTFVYQYKGNLASGKVKFNFSQYTALTFRGMWIQNTEAPKELNQGTIGKVIFEADLNDQFRIAPFYDYFRIEPDATVASFNDDRYTTNRIGYRTGMAFQFQKLVKITVAGGERDVVYSYTGITQQREKTWNLRLETLNVEL